MPEFNDVIFNMFMDKRNSGPCGCMGPQNGEPVCPCLMKYVRVVNGRYIKIEDLGPVQEKADDNMVSLYFGSINFSVNNKIRLIKLTREVFRCDLKEAKDFVESFPTTRKVNRNSAREIIDLYKNFNVHVEEV